MRTRFFKPFLRGCAILTLNWIVASSAHAESSASVELTAILAKWQAAISEPKRYEIRAQRIVYNKVVNVQRFANLLIHYDGPQSIRLEVRPIELAKNKQKARKITKNGQLFRMETESASLWIWNDQECMRCVPGTGRHIPIDVVVSIGHATKINSLNVPPPPAMPEDPLPWWQEMILRTGEFYLTSAAKALQPTKNGNTECNQWGSFSYFIFPEAHFPALFAADSPKLMKDVDWQIIKRTNDTIWLKGKPGSPWNRDVCREVTVILDTNTGRPKAQRTIDPSDNLETVIVFKEWNLNPTKSHFKFDRKLLDYEVFSYPPEFKLLSHRRRK